MSETYTPTGTVGDAVTRFTSAEAATGTFGTMDRDNVTEFADRTRYLDDDGTSMWVLRAGTYTPGDTTPTVAGISLLRISNSGPVTITQFDDGVTNQVIVLEFGDANTTINRANAVLAGGVNFTSSASDTLTLAKIGGTWTEIARAVSS